MPRPAAKTATTTGNQTSAISNLRIVEFGRRGPSDSPAITAFGSAPSAAVPFAWEGIFEGLGDQPCRPLLQTLGMGHQKPLHHIRRLSHFNVWRKARLIAVHSFVHGHCIGNAGLRNIAGLNVRARFFLLFSDRLCRKRIAHSSLPD